MNRCRRCTGFTLIEVIVVIILLGLLAAAGIAKYLSLAKAAESAAVESVIGSLRAALNIYAAKQITSGQIIAIHNPFDDLGNKPPTYSGSFPDVNSANCKIGQWVYQSGDPKKNGNLPLVIYHPKEPLTQGFPWEGIFWVSLELTEIKDARGTVVGLQLSDCLKYGGKPHQW